MANKGPQRPLGATDSAMRPGPFTLGSALSRAAARAMLAARMSSEDNEQGVEVVRGAKGSVVEIRGLGEAIRAARDRAEGKLAAARTIEGSQDYSRGGQADCLAERIRRARERVERMQGWDSTR
jgi:hypothetical protein